MTRKILVTCLYVLIAAGLFSCGSSNDNNPIANAGTDQNVVTGTLVTLDGSNSDGDGELLAYNWSFVSNPPGSNAALSDATVVRPTFTADVDGVYEVQLIVNDSNADTVVVTAATANSAPVADAGPDQSITTGSLVTLDGSTSSDANGDLLSYNWSFVSRPALSNAALSTGTVVGPTFTADVDGDYVLQLVVNDGVVDSVDDTVRVTAETANSAPVADAGPDQSIATGSLVTLDGSTSSDANGDLLSYNWSFVSRPALSNAALSTGTVVGPTFTADVDGDYVLQLVVNDGVVDSVVDSVRLTAATANSAPVADAGPDQSITTGSLVTLDGSTSSDANGDLLSYNWSFVSRPALSNAALSTGTVVGPTFTADVDGDYVLQLVVNDGVVDSVVDTVRVTAETANSAPVADAGPDQSIATGSLVTLDGSTSSDANGDLLSYNWSFVSRPALSNAALSTGTVVGPTFTADVDGDYVLQLVVNDGVVDSVVDSVRLTAATANSAPVADAGPDQSITTGSLVTLDGSTSSDADGNSLDYSWTFVSVPDGSALTQLTNAATTSPSFTPDVLGDYVIKLIVNDGFGDSLADNVTITAASLFVAGAWSATSTLVDDSAGSQWITQVAINEAGDMVAVWLVYDSGLGINNVYGSHYNSATEVWTSPLLLETIDVDADQLKLAIDATGNAVAVWTMDTGGFNSIYANRFDADTGQWGIALELDTTGEYTEAPAVGMDNTGNAIVVWLETLPVTNYESIKSRRFDSTGDWGLASWSSVVDLASGDVEYGDPHVAVNSAGDAIAMWAKDDKTTLAARRYNPTTPGWDSPVTFVYNPADNLIDINLAIDAQGNIVVIWSQNTPRDLYANYLYAGESIWDGVASLENLTTNVEDFHVAMDGNGNAFAIWAHLNSLFESPANRDVYASRYDVLTGWGPPEQIDSDTAQASEVAIAMDSSGNALAHWISEGPVSRDPVVNRYNAATSTWNGTELLAPGGRFSSLAANSSGQAVLAWVNGVTDPSTGNWITKLYINLLR